jgi:sugar/nucleoside kinase (ribokinase family)
MGCGLFVGLTTVDVVYHVDALPQPNQKIVAQDYAIAAGGPATNAAIAFRHLGQHSTHLVSIIGRHALADVVRADLTACEVSWLDLQPDWVEPLPVSSILVTPQGDRAVVSLNAKRAAIAAEQMPALVGSVLQRADVVLIDGHQMQVGSAIAAQAADVLVVVDAGSWKPGFEAVLSQADYVICSANFYPPGCQTADEVMAYLQALKVPHIAISNGDRPIQVCDRGRFQTIDVPTVQAIDTLGAGDILHGAFCHWILSQPFIEALHRAAIDASEACQFMGTRRWMQASLPNGDGSL